MCDLISAWLDDTENTPPRRHLSLASAPPTGAISPAKRKRLANFESSVRHMAERTTSPSKGKGRTRKIVDEVKDASPEDDRKTLRETRTRSQTLAANVTNTTAAGIVLDTPFKQFPPSVRAITASYPTGSSASQAFRIPLRSKSPVEDATDLEMADTPIYQCSIGEVALTKCAETLFKKLRDIAEGDGLVPKTIAELMKQDRDSDLRLRHLATTELRSPESGSPESDLDDFKQMVKIWGYARQLEKDEAYEVAWNSEVHSDVFKLALGPYVNRVWHFNITQARPVLAFLPTRASKISESLLVDYSINIIPTFDEKQAIYRLISTEDEKQSTITQTKTNTVRIRPCIISIVTKTDSGSTNAQTQLAVWGAAHFARLISLFGPSPEEDILSIHPVIHAQQHGWRLYLLVARQGCKSIDEIDLNLCIGGTETLLELWKLRASLRCLARWGEEDYWPVLLGKIRAANEIIAGN